MTNSIKWRSPSNIALIKYWGKKGNQLPANASLSFTLSNSFTETELRFSKKKFSSKEIELAFFFEGKAQPDFEIKIKKYFQNISAELPFLTKYKFEIHSTNSFPHSVGIASSASGMSALALCVCSLEELEKGTASKHEDFFRRASVLSRLGSGSASRSVYGGIVTWGKIEGLPASSDEFASPFQGKTDTIFHDFHDDILVVSSQKKDVSSRAGHELMNVHPFAQSRFMQAAQNLQDLIKTLETGDLMRFCDIVENEALTLHALMFSSSPAVVLFQPGTVDIIKKVRKFREQTGIPVCFTIDAGPNVHLLYPDRAKVDIGQLIERELVVSCEHNQVISDSVGKGPLKLSA